MPRFSNSGLRRRLLASLAQVLRRVADWAAPEPLATEALSDGPPADWLKRVREGAPQLLVAPAEGGTPEQIARASGVPMPPRAADPEPVARRATTRQSAPIRSSVRPLAPRAPAMGETVPPPFAVPHATPPNSTTPETRRQHSGSQSTSPAKPTQRPANPATAPRLPEIQPVQLEPTPATPPLARVSKVQIDSRTRVSASAPSSAPPHKRPAAARILPTLFFTPRVQTQLAAVAQHVPDPKPRMEPPAPDNPGRDRVAPPRPAVKLQDDSFRLPRQRALDASLICSGPPKPAAGEPDRAVSLVTSRGFAGTSYFPSELVPRQRIAAIESPRQTREFRIRDSRPDVEVPVGRRSLAQIPLAPASPSATPNIWPELPNDPEPTRSRWDDAEERRARIRELLAEQRGEAPWSA